MDPNSLSQMQTRKMVSQTISTGGKALCVRKQYLSYTLCNEHNYNQATLCFVICVILSCKRSINCGSYALTTETRHTSVRLSLRSIANWRTKKNHPPFPSSSGSSVGGGGGDGGSTNRISQARSPQRHAQETALRTTVRRREGGEGGTLKIFFFPLLLLPSPVRRRRRRFWKEKRQGGRRGGVLEEGSSFGRRGWGADGRNFYPRGG